MNTGPGSQKALERNNARQREESQRAKAEEQKRLDRIKAEEQKEIEKKQAIRKWAADHVFDFLAFIIALIALIRTF